MNQWWASLAPRERLMVIACAVVVAAAVFYLMIWAPLAQRHAALVTRVDAQRKTLTWMHQASQRVLQLRRQNPEAAASVDNRSLLTIVDTSARQAKLRTTIQRMEPEGDDGVKLSIDNARFDALIQWVGVLKRNHGIDTARATISPDKSPGLVDARLSLRRLK